MNFADEFRKRVAVLDGKLPPPVIPISSSKKRYGLFKRSLPVGVNKRVLFGLTLEDLPTVKAHFKAKEAEAGIIYYEVVEESHPLEDDVFWNPSFVNDIRTKENDDE